MIDLSSETGICAMVRRERGVNGTGRHEVEGLGEVCQQNTLPEMLGSGGVPRVFLAMWGFKLTTLGTLKLCHTVTRIALVAIGLRTVLLQFGHHRKGCGDCWLYLAS